MSNRHGSPQIGTVNFVLLIVISVLLIVGLVAWLVYAHQPHPTIAASPASIVNTQSSTGSVATAPQIRSTSDLKDSIQTLDQNDPVSTNSGDLNQLNQESNDF